MPDSTYPANLPPGYPAYLGYADGQWPTAPVLRQQHPGAHVLALTVTGATLEADGCDIEAGDLSPWSGAGWARAKLEAAPASRPVLYASVSLMPTVISACQAAGVSRDRVRLLSAHYTHAPHICGPGSCGELSTDADGTQWTDAFPGVNGTLVDMSLLRDGFFGSTVEWTEFDMAKLRVLKLGDADAPGQFWAVRRLQGNLFTVGHILGIPDAVIAVDGQFGPKTDAAVRAVQKHYGITQDGICGQATWSVLLTGSAA